MRRITSLIDWVINLGITVPRATLDTIAVVLITLILSYFTLVFGELVPKRVAMKKAEALGLGISGLIRGISIVFKPIVWFLSASTDAVLRLLGIDPNEEDEQVSEEEIRMMEMLVVKRVLLTNRKKNSSRMSLNLTT